MNKITYIFRCTLGDSGSPLYFPTLKTAMAYITAAETAVHTDPSLFSVILSRVDSRHSAYEATNWDVKSASQYEFKQWLRLGQPTTKAEAETAAALAEKVTA